MAIHPATPRDSARSGRARPEGQHATRRDHSARERSAGSALKSAVRRLVGGRSRPQAHPVATGSLLERPDLRIGNLLDDPRLRLAVFGHEGQRDETAA